MNLHKNGDNKYYAHTVFSIEEVDEHDNPVQRTKQEHPYSYDGFVTWRGGPNSEVTGTVYSDRLWQWDHEKYNSCRKEVFGDEAQIFYGDSSEKIEKMLQLYMKEAALKLILIMEYCNQSSGYAVWRFDYKIDKI